MSQILPGILYTLSGGNSLRFTRLSSSKDVVPGTTNEEVLEVLIDRINYLQDKLPCSENVIALHHLTTALSALNLRSQKRETQMVTNTDIPHRG